MRTSGTLAKWNDDRGFGFIATTHGAPEVFVHISAFPPDGLRPRIDEPLTFDVEADAAGRKRATNLVCSSRSVRLPVNQTRPSGKSDKSSWLERAVFVVLVAVLVSYGYREYSRRATQQPAAASDVSEETTVSRSSQEETALSQRAADSFSSSQDRAITHPEDRVSPSSFKCDGRTSCSQMTSCDEATFFLRTCPTVRMDGDHDGVPCERQWCN